MLKLQVGIFIWLILTTLSQETLGQTRDSSQAVGGLTRDTFYIIHENIPKNKFLGNSWYTSASYNFSSNHEIQLNIGRTYGNIFVSGGGFNCSMKSWGLGYARFDPKNFKGQTVSAFAEASNYFLPPGTVRMDYIYDFKNQRHYLRPSVGLCLVSFDLLYGYSLKMAGTVNDFRHGFILRLKLFPKSDDWQKNYPNRC